MFKKDNMQGRDLGKFRDIAKSIVPVPSFKVAEVNIDLDDGTFKTYVEQEHMMLNMCQGAPVPPQEDLAQLMYDLICLRVAQVRGTRLPFAIIGTKFVIPSFLDTILNALGRVESDEFGLILLPNPPQARRESDRGDNGYDKRSFEEITQEVVTISRSFRPYFDAAGVEYTTELPSSREGDVKLLMFDTRDNVVQAESKVPEPVFAIMAAIIGVRPKTGVDIKPFMVARMNYGPKEFYKLLTYHVGDYERKKA